MIAIADLSRIALSVFGTDASGMLIDLWTFANVVCYRADDDKLRVAFHSAYQVIEPA